MRRLPYLVHLLTLPSILTYAQTRPTATDYHTIYSSADNKTLYGQSSLDVSGMSIPPGTTIVHTATAKFSLGVKGGTQTTFQAVQSGGPQSYLDPVATGNISEIGDAIYLQILYDSAVCNFFGNFFLDNSQVSYIDSPVVSRVDVYPSTGSTYPTIYAGTTGVLAIYGSNFTAAGTVSPTVSVTNGVTITGYEYRDDGQINADYTALNAQIGTAGLTVLAQVTSDSQSVPVAAPVISGISPTTIMVGAQGVNLTIDGSGFASSPTINLPSGVSVKSQSSTSSRITLSVNVGNTTKIGNTSISVANNGATSNSVTLTMNGPYCMTVDSDITNYCKGCSSTIERDVDYQIFNFDGTKASGSVPICEAFSSSSWNCSQTKPTLITTVCNTGATSRNGGAFLDSWTLGSDKYTPAGCGLDGIVDHWQWNPQGAQQTIGTLNGYAHTNAININGSTTTKTNPASLIGVKICP